MKEEKELAEANNDENADRHEEVLKRLEEIDAYSAPARASHILNGLGFDHSAQNT